MLVERTKFDKLLKELDEKFVSILIGARQVGKSTLMKELEKNTKKSCRYLNLEDPRDLSLFEDGYVSFIKEVEEDIVFIDEFHYYKNITSVFKAVYDLNPEKKIIASGSSSLEIHKHLKESLAGRKTETIIYPLSFSEYILQFDLEIPDIGNYISSKLRFDLEKYLLRFLKYGAMPGLIEFEHRDDLKIREYLYSIYRTYISKDIKTFLRDESIINFNKIIEYLAINNAQALSSYKLSKSLNIPESQINKQLEVMRETFVLGVLKPFFKNKTKEISKTPKTFFYDLGIANAILNDFRDLDKRLNHGAILETFVYWEMIKSMDLRYELRYWRSLDDQEVDFVLSKDGDLLPVEVKAKWDKNKIPNGIKAFLRKYPEESKAAIILADFEDETEYQGHKIYFMPWYRAHQLVELLI